MIDNYRIRESAVKVFNGWLSYYDRRFIGERLVTVWIFHWYIPVLNGGWRSNRNEAMDDIKNDKWLRDC